MPTTTSSSKSHRIQILADVSSEFGEILTPEALNFVAQLQHEFADRRDSLLTARKNRQRELDDGAMPDFLESTRSIRVGNWQIAP
ncbi:MAG: hypothetical protein B6D36_18385, partial [Planctomycetes bacterium UTPLA1]